MIPFLKWAGGKRWLAPHLQNAIPKTFNAYIEPFLGGAALFFALQPNRAILSDINADLIATYGAVRDNWQLVRRYLGEFAGGHCKLQYYRARSEVYRSRFRSAARFIYLNRVCWNGLYRVNLRGEFNVPLGTKTTVLLNSDDFAGVSKLLTRASLFSCDFEKTIDAAEEGDFVFIDPPYITAHNFNGFIKYNEKLFGWDDQVRLRNAVERAKLRGARILISNADHVSIRELYDGLGQIKSIERPSVIAASADCRHSTTELLIQMF